MSKIDDSIEKIKRNAQDGITIEADEVLFLIDYIEHLKGRKASER
jgi:hypothetical protein